MIGRTPTLGWHPKHTIMITGYRIRTQIRLGNLRCFPNSLSIQYFSNEFTMNSPFSSRIHFEPSIDFANSLSIHYLFRDLPIIRYIIREFTYDSLSISRNQFVFLISFANSLSIHFEFTICFANSLQIE